MKFTNAFLTAILFCGVTPLAINRKIEDHALTIIPSPFATPLSVSLVTLNDAGIEHITDGTHDALEARKRSTEPKPITKPNPNTKPKLNTNPKPKTTPTADPNTIPKPKTDPKEEAVPSCTSKQKKAGQCPVQKKKKKKNWEVLNPTKGCRPQSCNDCGKAKGAKSDKKGGKTIKESLRSLTFSKRAATAEPVSKTEAGLMAWTKDVWASSPRALHLPPEEVQPTSFFVRWSSLGQGVNFVTLKNLMGCTSVVVASDEGVYVSHHWQHTVSDAAHDDVPPLFDNAFTNPLAGKRRASFKLTAAQKKVALEFVSEAEAKKAADDVFPETGFEALTDFKSSFTAASNVQSMVAVWDGVIGSGDKFIRAGPIMRSYVDGLLPGTATKLIQYANTEDAKFTSDSEADYHGKVIVSYDSSTKKYQVWMPGAKLDGPILKN